MKKLLILFLFIIIGVGCGGGKKGKNEVKTAQDYIKEGWNYYQNKDYDKAITQFNQSMTLSPTHTQLAKAYTGIGFSHLQKGNYNEALNNFIKAKENDPTYKDAYIGEASCYFSQQKYQKIIDLLSNKLNFIGSDYKFPYYPVIDYADLCAILAAAYYNLEDYNNARTYVDLALIKDSNNPLAKEIKEKLEYL